VQDEGDAWVLGCGKHKTCDNRRRPPITAHGVNRNNDFSGCLPFRAWPGGDGRVWANRHALAQ